LSGDLQAQDFTKAIGEGLQRAALPLFFLQFFYRLFAPEGIARKHFSMAKNHTSLLRKQCLDTVYCGAWSIFNFQKQSFRRIVTVLASGIDHYHGSMAVFAGRVLKPTGGLLQD